MKREKILNKLWLVSLILSIMFSCRTAELYKSLDIIQHIENQKYTYENHDFPKVFRDIEDREYKNFYDFRKKVINSFIKQKQFENFALKENFYFDDVTGTKRYSTAVITKDSVYTFSKILESKNENRYVYPLSTYNKWTELYYNFKEDSLFVSRRLSGSELIYMNQGLPLPEIFFTNYISYYKESILDKLTINDSTVYKIKKSTAEIDLKKYTLIGTDGSICTTDTRTEIIDCGYIRLGNCKKNKKGIIISCDTLKY